MSNKTTPKKLRFENKELEAQTQSRNSDGTALAINLAKDQAVSLNPPVEEKQGSMYIRKIKNFFQETISLIKSSLQIELARHEVDDPYYREKEASIREAVGKADHELGLAERKVAKSVDKGQHKALRKKNRLKWVRLVSILFISADFFISASVFQKLHFPLIASYMMAAGIAGAIMIAAEATPFLVSKVEGKRKKQLVVIAMLTLLSVIFYFIAYLRTTDMDDGSSTGTPRLVFVALNLLLAGASMYLMWRHKPTKKEIADLDEYQELVGETKKIETKKQQLQDELYALLKERQEKEEMEISSETVLFSFLWLSGLFFRNLCSIS